MLYEIKLTRTPKNGESTDTKEHFILDAELHADAETQGFELYPDHTVDVTAVFRSDIKEIINDIEKDEEHFYKGTVCDVTVDENGKEKTLKYKMLVAASSVAEATERLNTHLRQGYDMRLDGVVRSRINGWIR